MEGEGGGNQTGPSTPLQMLCYFPYVFIPWYWCFSNNQVTTWFLSDLHLLLRRKHLQPAPTTEHNRRHIYNPLPPQQNTAAVATRPADNGVSLAGVDVAALGDAAARGGSGQLSRARTSAWTVNLSDLWSCLWKTGFPPHSSLMTNSGAWEVDVVEGGKTITCFSIVFWRNSRQMFPESMAETDAYAFLNACLFSKKKHYLKVLYACWLLVLPLTHMKLSHCNLLPR